MNEKLESKNVFQRGVVKIRKIIFSENGKLFEDFKSHIKLSPIILLKSSDLFPKKSRTFQRFDKVIRGKRIFMKIVQGRLVSKLKVPLILEFRQND